MRWLGAMQAQDYAGAKWALALRSAQLTDADVEAAFDAGRILRTHVPPANVPFFARSILRPKNRFGYGNVDPTTVCPS